MSEKLCALRKIGGGMNIPTYELGTGVTEVIVTSSVSYTYTATKECVVIVNTKINYNTSGYRRISLNGVQIVNSTEKGDFCDMLHLRAGDVINCTRDTFTAYNYNICVIDWEYLS